MIQVEPHIICIKSDGGQRSYSVIVDGQQLASFDSLLESLDLLYKMFWVFKLKYTPSVLQVYKFLEYTVFEDRIGRTANCVRELATICERSSS